MPMILLIGKLKQLFNDTKSILYIILFYLGCEENSLYHSIKHLQKTTVRKKGQAFSSYIANLIKQFINSNINL